MYHLVRAQLLKRQSRWQMFTQNRAAGALRYWCGTTSADPTDINNWSDTDGGSTPATNLPTVHDTVYFTSNGNNPCTLTADLRLKSLVTLSGYTAKIDLATFDLSLRSGNLTLDGAGEFDCGTGTHLISNGNFDYKDVGTWTYATATWVLSGVCNITCKGLSTSGIYNLTIATNATVTHLDGTVMYIYNHLDIDGTYAVSVGKRLSTYWGTTVTVVIKANGNITGPGNIQFYLNTDSGISLLEGTITCNEVLFFITAATTVLLPATTYSPNTLIFKTTVATSRILRLNAGNYIFDCDLVLHSQSGAGSLEFDTDTNNANVLITGDLSVDILGATGSVTVDSGGDWEIQGDVDFTPGIGTGVTWESGSGTMTFSGAADQDINFNGESVEAIDIDKTAGILTFTGDIITNSLLGTSGTIDFNSKTIESLNSIILTINCDIIAGNDAMNGCTIITGFDFTASGSAGDLLNLRGTASWTLNVGDTGMASYVDVSYSNATGMAITATNSTNSGDNSDWNFS